MPSEIKISIDWGTLPDIDLPDLTFEANTGTAPSVNWGTPPEWSWGQRPGWTWGNIATGEEPGFTGGGEAPGFKPGTGTAPSFDTSNASPPRINWATRDIVDAIAAALAEIGDINVNITRGP